MAKRIGSKTLILSSSPSIIGYAAVGAKQEKQGPLAGYFDLLSDDSSFGQKTWEKAETHMQKTAIELALQSAIPKKIRSIFCLQGIFSTSASVPPTLPVIC